MEEKNQTNTNNSTTDTSTVIPPVEPTEAASVEIETPVVMPTEVTPTADVAPALTPIEVINEAVVAPTVTIDGAETTAVATPSIKSTVIKQYVIAGVIIILMGGGLLYALEAQGRIQTNVFGSINALITPTPLAAIVNGVEISVADFEKNKSQLEKAAQGQGADIANASIQDEIKKQAIDVLVNTELLKQSAVQAGIAVTPEQIADRRAKIVESVGGEDKLQEKMTELNITAESLASDIESEILIQTYLAKAVDVSKVTIDPKEVQAIYDQANTPDAKLPPLAQVKAEIEAKIRSDKEQEMVNAFIDTLRSNATIEVKI